MFVCFWDGYVNDEAPTISSDEFTEFKWQSINELNEMDFVPGLDRDIRVGWEFFSMYKILPTRNI
jgi:hypothetical protein